MITQWFGDVPELGLAAEKGAFIRWPASYAERCFPDRARLLELEAKYVACPVQPDLIGDCGTNTAYWAPLRVRCCVVA